MSKKKIVDNDSKSAEEIDPIEESKKIVKTADDAGAVLRLMGGLAIRVHCHGPHSVHLRAYQDIDLFGLTKQYGRILSVFQKLGYSPNARFNALYGGTRLQFIGSEGHRNVDLFMDKFSMQHTLDFRERLRLDDLTIPITDLLLTKLQNVRLTEKDEKDIIAIVEDHEIGHSDEKETMNIDYAVGLCAKDWGLYKSIVDNLGRMTGLIENDQTSALDKEKLVSKLEAIQEAIQSVQKKLRWKLRSVIGERVKWYDEVELSEGEV